MQVQELLADDAELLGKYRDSLMCSYVEDNAMVCWCPSVPHCGNAVRADVDPHCEPTCSCGLKFCFACGDEPHSPCTCEMCVKPPSHHHHANLSSSSINVPPHCLLID